MDFHHRAESEYQDRTLHADLLAARVAKGILKKYLRSPVAPATDVKSAMPLDLLTKSLDFVTQSRNGAGKVYRTGLD